jgi:hypothetical protein
MKQRVTGVNLRRGLDHHDFRVQTVSTKRCQFVTGVGPPLFPCTNRFHKTLQPFER